MAVGTHGVPVLRLACPMQNIIMVYWFIAVEVEPALTTFRFSATIPSHAQRLNPAIGQLHQILLQRVSAERVQQFEGLNAAIRSRSSHFIGIIFYIELSADTLMLKPTVVKVALDGLWRHRLHSLVVMRLLPVVILGRMTILAVGTAYVVGRCGRAYSFCAGIIAATEQGAEQQDYN